jgi:hypothetical protein
MPVVVPHNLTSSILAIKANQRKRVDYSRSVLQILKLPKMKFSLISLIALALTSTSVMAAVAVEKRAQALYRDLGPTVPGTIFINVAKGRKSPRTDAPTSAQYYRAGDAINIFCHTAKGTTAISND